MVQNDLVRLSSDVFSDAHSASLSKYIVTCTFNLGRRCGGQWVTNERIPFQFKIYVGGTIPDSYRGWRRARHFLHNF